MAQLEEAKNQVSIYERGWRQAPNWKGINDPTTRYHNCVFAREKLPGPTCTYCITLPLCNIVGYDAIYIT